jgi:hypothetical protein
VVRPQTGVGSSADGDGRDDVTCVGIWDAQVNRNPVELEGLFDDSGLPMAGVRNFCADGAGPVVAQAAYVGAHGQPAGGAYRSVALGISSQGRPANRAAFERTVTRRATRYTPTMPNPKNENDALEKVLRGGPRACLDAAMWLRPRIQNGTAPSLPPVESAIEANRARLRALHGLNALVVGDFPAWHALVDGVADRDERGALIREAAARGAFAPSLSTLAQALLADADPENVVVGLALCGRWLHDGLGATADLFERVCAALPDRRRVKTGGSASVGAAAEGAMLRAAAGPGAPLLVPHWQAAAAGTDAARRTLAARCLTRRALAASDVSALSGLVLHANAAVRRAAIDTFTTGDPVVARQQLVLAARAPFLARAVLADALAAGMEPGFPAATEVLEARNRLFADDVEVRRAAVGRIAALSSDMVDVRIAAPHLGLVLFDPDAAVRNEAAMAVYWLCDLQGPVHLVRSLRLLLEHARPSFDGEAGACLDSASKRISG